MATSDDENDFLEEEFLVNSADLFVGTKLMGEGRSELFHGELMGQAVTIKKAVPRIKESDMLLHLKHQATILSVLRHPKVALFMALCIEPENTCMIMEPMDGTTLEGLLTSTRPTLSTMMRISKEIAVGLNWMHRQGVIHCDLKPANILITKTNEVKLFEFGLARFRHSRPRKKLAGSLPYMAPELFLTKSHNESSDVYAYAVTLLRLWSGLTEEELYEVTSASELVDFIKDGRRPSIPSQIPPIVKNIIQDCWAQDPDARPPFRTIIDRLGSLADMLVDASGLEVWQKLNTSPGYPFVVKWEDLRRIVSETLEISMSDVFFSCLEPLLVASDEVACERFSRYLEVFGLEPHHIEDFLSLCKNGSFRGDIDNNEADKILQGQPKGTFILRLSSMPGYVTISKTTAKGKKYAHQRIRKLKDGYIAADTERCYPTITEMLKKERRALKLKNPPKKPSPFSAPFVKPPKHSDEVGVYIPGGEAAWHNLDTSNDEDQEN